MIEPDARPLPANTLNQAPRGTGLALAAVLFGGLLLGPLNAAFADDHSGHQGHGALIEPIAEHCLFCIDGVTPSLSLDPPGFAANGAKSAPKPAPYAPPALSRRPALASARGPPHFLP